MLGVEGVEAVQALKSPRHRRAHITRLRVVTNEFLPPGLSSAGTPVLPPKMTKFLMGVAT
jgi:hypothetical protein